MSTLLKSTYWMPAPRRRSTVENPEGENRRDATTRGAFSYRPQ
jgi:hypothetical protein